MAIGLRCGQQPSLTEARDLQQLLLPTLPELDDPKTACLVRIFSRLQAFSEEVSGRMAAVNRTPDSEA